MISFENNNGKRWPAIILVTPFIHGAISPMDEGAIAVTK